MTLTDPAFIESLRVLIDAHQRPVVIPDPPVTSPTGREPTLLWTPAWQTLQNRMKAEADAGSQSLGAVWYRDVLAQALVSRSGDTGLCAALAYQRTGDVVHAAKALAVIKANVFWTGTMVSNHLREYAVEYVLMLDVLWPALTTEERDLYFAALDRAFMHPTILGPLPTSPLGLRLGDSDQTTGTYMAVAMYATAFGDVHPPAAAFLARLGGLVSTGSNASTARNAVRTFIERAAGGEWVEAGEYNLGTIRLVLLGYYALLAAGVDTFPEITAWIPAVATRFRHFSSPNLDEQFQWGDDQGPHAYEVEQVATPAAMVDHPQARQMVLDLVAKYGALGTYTAKIHPRAHLLFNPYGPVEPPSVLPTTFNGTAGQGIVISRTAWDDPAASYLFQQYHRTFWPLGPLDHSLRNFGDLQLIRNKAWALTHPITYGGPSVSRGQGCNTFEAYNLGCPAEYRGAVVFAEGAGWTYTAGTSGGSLYVSGGYYPPPVFWHEFSRAVLYLKSDVNDLLIVCDRTHVVDPRTLPNFIRHASSATWPVQSLINAGPMRKWHWHCPVVPTIAGQSATWAYGTGASAGTARVSWLDPSLTATAINEATAWNTPAYANVVASEKLHHVQLVPPDADGFHALVTVLEFGSPAAFRTITPIAEGDVTGVRLARAGQADLVALFNAAPGPVLQSVSSAQGVYGASNPGTLATVRLRTTPVVYTPAAGARVWWPETAEGVRVTEAA